MEIPGWAKTVALPIFIVVLGVTLTYLVQNLGLLAIASMWLILGLVMVGGLALMWRSRMVAEIARNRDLLRQTEALRARPKRAVEERPLAGDGRTPTPKADSLEARATALAEKAARVRAETERAQADKERVARVRLEEQKNQAEEALADTTKRLADTTRQLDEATRRLDVLQTASHDKGVILATDLTCTREQPMDVVSKRLKRNTEIEILAQGTGRFSFYLFDTQNLSRFAKEQRNWESIAGKENVAAVYRERVTIPRSDEWYFVVTPAEEGERVEVQLVVKQLEITPA